MANEQPGSVPEQPGSVPEQPGSVPDDKSVKSQADLLAELETMRKALKEATKEAVDRKKRLADLEAEETKRKEAELSEVQKLQKHLADAKAAAEAREREVADLRLRSAVENAATKLNFVTPADAYLLADLSGIEMTTDGKMTGVEDALKALLKDRPYLANGSKPDGKGTPRTGQQTQGREPATEDTLERKRRQGGYSSL